MNRGNRPRALLVFGVPMSGKSTFAKHFSEQFRAPHLDLTSLERDHQIPRKSILVIIKEIAKCQQTIILEGGIGTESDRNEIRDLLRANGYTPVLVWIQTDIATVRKRMVAKFGGKSKKIFDEEVAALEAPVDAEVPVVISGKHTFESQLRSILSNLSRDDIKR